MKIVRFRGRFVVLAGVCLVCVIALLRTVTFLNDVNWPTIAPVREHELHINNSKLKAAMSQVGKYRRFGEADVIGDAKERVDSAASSSPESIKTPSPERHETFDVNQNDRRAFHRSSLNENVIAQSDVKVDDVQLQQIQNLGQNRFLKGRADALHGQLVKSKNDELKQILPAYLNLPDLSKPVKYPILTSNNKFVPSRRIVHSDLKGAHPKVGYFKLLLPFLARLGVTGLLIEYEDVFPYTGVLAKARSKNAYSKSELKQILAWARENQLEVIPLVQTFGHLEWFLKLETFASYRELDRYAQMIFPSNFDAVQLVKTSIDQVMEFHRDTSEFFHIGADEAFQVGQCVRCQETMRKQLGGSRDRLMLRHIVNISSYVKETYGKRVLMWHDMLYNVDSMLVKEYKLDEMVEPVLWSYAENISDTLSFDMWLNFESNFPFIWGASAFKGADGLSRYHSNVPHYVRNHVSWIENMQRQFRHFREWRGLIFTGWQRFDHFAVLCELLPVGLPSLVTSLLAVTHAVYNEDVLKLASSAMQCSSDFETTYPLFSNMPPGAAINYCNFPGAKIYQSVQMCYNSQVIMHYQLMQDYQVQGWLSNFNIKHNYSSAWYLDKIMDKVHMHRAEMADCLKQLRIEMPTVFHNETIEEFIYEHIQSDIQLLENFSNKAQLISMIRYFPVRPFPIRNFSAPSEA